MLITYFIQLLYCSNDSKKASPKDEKVVNTEQNNSDSKSAFGDHDKTHVIEGLASNSAEDTTKPSKNTCNSNKSDVVAKDHPMKNTQESSDLSHMQCDCGHNKKIPLPNNMQMDEAIIILSSDCEETEESGLYGSKDINYDSRTKTNTNRSSPIYTPLSSEIKHGLNIRAPYNHPSKYLEQSNAKKNYRVQSQLNDDLLALLLKLNPLFSIEKRPIFELIVVVGCSMINNSIRKNICIDLEFLERVNKYNTSGLKWDQFHIFVQYNRHYIQNELCLDLSIRKLDKKAPQWNDNYFKTFDRLPINIFSADGRNFRLIIFVQLYQLDRSNVDNRCYYLKFKLPIDFKIACFLKTHFIAFHRNRRLIIEFTAVRGGFFEFFLCKQIDIEQFDALSEAIPLSETKICRQLFLENNVGENLKAGEEIGNSDPPSPSITSRLNCVDTYEQRLSNRSYPQNENISKGICDVKTTLDKQRGVPGHPFKRMRSSLDNQSPLDLEFNPQEMQMACIKTKISRCNEQKNRVNDDPRLLYQENTPTNIKRKSNSRTDHQISRSIVVDLEESMEPNIGPAGKQYSMPLYDHQKGQQNTYAFNSEENAGIVAKDTPRLYSNFYGCDGSRDNREKCQRPLSAIPKQQVFGSFGQKQPQHQEIYQKNYYIPSHDHHQQFLRSANSFHKNLRSLNNSPAILSYDKDKWVVSPSTPTMQSNMKSYIDKQYHSTSDLSIKQSHPQNQFGTGRKTNLSTSNISNELAHAPLLEYTQIQPYNYHSSVDRSPIFKSDIESEHPRFYLDNTNESYMKTNDNKHVHLSTPGRGFQRYHRERDLGTLSVSGGEHRSITPKIDRSNILGSERESMYRLYNAPRFDQRVELNHTNQQMHEKDPQISKIEFPHGHEKNYREVLDHSEDRESYRIRNRNDESYKVKRNTTLTQIPHEADRIQQAHPHVHTSMPCLSYNMGSRDMHEDESANAQNITTIPKPIPVYACDYSCKKYDDIHNRQIAKSQENKPTQAYANHPFDDNMMRSYGTETVSRESLDKIPRHTYFSQYPSNYHLSKENELEHRHSQDYRSSSIDQRVNHNIVQNLDCRTQILSKNTNSNVISKNDKDYDQKGVDDNNDLIDVLN